MANHYSPNSLGFSSAKISCDTVIWCFNHKSFTIQKIKEKVLSNPSIQWVLNIQTFES